MIVINARFLTQKVSGIQRFAIDLSRELNKSGLEFGFATPKNVLSEETAKELNVIRYGKLKGHLWEQIELPVYLRKNGNPLLINLGNTAPMKYNNMVTLIADLSFSEPENWFSWSFKTLYNFMIPRVAVRSRKILAMSNFTRNELIRKYNIPPEKIVVIYGAVSKDLARYQQSHCSMHLTDNDNDYILCVSSLDPRKNLSTLITSYLKCNFKEIKLRIVGACNKIFSDPGISRMIKGNHNIVLEGYVPDLKLASLYSKALFFVYPSLYEGFGLPPLEAMYFGCPTIVSDIPPLREVCDNASLYVNPLDSNDIAIKIRSLAGDKSLREELRRKGYERARYFTINTSVSKLIGMINSLDADK